MTDSPTTSSLTALSNAMADAVELVGKQVVTVSARGRGAASGVYWQPGVVVTADHVVQRDEDIKVTFPDGSRREAVLGGRDPSTDLAIIKVDTTGLPASSQPVEKQVRVGVLAIAVARPESGLAVSFGAVSAVNGAWRTSAGGRIDQLIRPDVTFYPGFSGGPLIDGEGGILGINTSGLSRHMSVTVPTSTVNRVTEQLLRSGRIPRGYLGLKMQPVVLPESTKTQLALQQGTGLIVIGVEPDGPAQKAGALVGDILIGLDGSPIDHPATLETLLDPDTVGKQVRIRIIRGGIDTELPVTVGDRPGREGKRG